MLEALKVSGSRPTLLFSALLSATALITLAPAAEILSWRVPKDVFASTPEYSLHPTDPEKAPSPSVFIRPGDRLLKTLETPEGIEWILWNETSQRWIAKGAWNALSTLHWKIHRRQFIPIAEITIRIHGVTDRSDVPDFTAAPLATEILRVRSGERPKKEPAPIDRTRPCIRAIIEGTLQRFESPVLEIACKITGSIPGNPDIEVLTQFYVNDGKPVWFARDFDGKRGLDFSIESHSLWFDGSPLPERLMIEKNDKAVPFYQVRKRIPDGDIIKLPNGQWLFGFNPQPVLEAVAQIKPPNRDVDPFDQVAKEKKFALKSIPRPEALAPWVDHELLDILSGLKSMDLAGEIPDHAALIFAGADPIGERAFGIATNHKTAESFLWLMSGLTRDFSNQISVTFQDHGERRLLLFSGGRGSLRRIGADSTTQTLDFASSFIPVEPHRDKLFISETFIVNDQATEKRHGTVIVDDPSMVPMQMTNEAGTIFQAKLGARREQPFSQP